LQPALISVAYINSRELLLLLNTFLVLLNVMFAGFYLNKSNMPFWTDWIPYVSYIRYVFEGLIGEPAVVQAFSCAPR
jgi:hypothetical protein